MSKLIFMFKNLPIDNSGVGIVLKKYENSQEYLVQWYDFFENKVSCSNETEKYIDVFEVDDFEYSQHLETIKKLELFEFLCTHNKFSYYGKDAINCNIGEQTFTLSIDDILYKVFPQKIESGVMNCLQKYFEIFKNKKPSETEIGKETKYSISFIFSIYHAYIKYFGNVPLDEAIKKAIFNFQIKN